MGSTAVVASARWESLPARPPTPPREAHHEPEPPMPKEAIFRPALDPRLSLQTPPNLSSPLSNAADSTGSARRAAAKRVGFSAETEYKEPPIYPTDEKDGLSLPSAPSSSQPRPVKGILKPTFSPNPLESSIQNGDGSMNLAAMLESTIKQLAGPDRDAKLDAYSMLVQALRASNNLPDRVALHDKMGDLVKFMERDIASPPADGAVGGSLGNHALLLLCTLLHYPKMASSIPNDFAIFVIDHAIKVLGDPQTPKDVARHVMQVLLSQNFPPKVLTAERVGKLLGVLHKIDGQHKGKSIVVTRAYIYRRLLGTSKTHMAGNSDWILDLFTDLTSSFKEIRNAAIELGFEAAIVFGKEKVLAKKTWEVFNLAVEDVKFSDYFLNKVRAIANSRPESAVVPKIWSVVVLFLRSSLENWKTLQAWLKLIQACFNSSDYPTKIEANYAWNRFVYVMHGDSRMSSRLESMITQPYDSQLKRKSGGKQAEEDLRKVVIGGICNLFYYTFKPGTTAAMTDSYWDLVVKPIMQQFIRCEANPTSQDEQLTQACAVLSGLFDSSVQRIWREDRVFDKALVRPEELPALDPKWLRRNPTRVFGVVEPLLLKKLSDLNNQQSPIYTLWRTLMAMVGQAGSKDVLVSEDTAIFVAHVLGLLHKLWTMGASAFPGQLSSADFLASIQEFLLAVVDPLGLLPFTEKMMVMTKQHTFTPVATPSHRSGKSTGVTMTPLHHIFSILSTLPEGVADNEDFCQFTRAVFAPFMVSKSAQAQSRMVQEMLQAMPSQSLLPFGPWVLASEAITESIRSSRASLSNSPSGSEPLGHELRDVVKLLERGLFTTPNLPVEHWDTLFEELCAYTVEETGEAGRAIAVIEPLAKSMLEQLGNLNAERVPQRLTGAVSALFNFATQPRDRQAVEIARRRLWGTSVTGSRPGLSDPFDYLYKLGNIVLERLYHGLASYDADDVTPLLKDVTEFLSRCNPQSVVKTIANLQDGISPWVQDEKSQLSSREGSAVAVAVKLLWDRICSILRSLEAPESIPLDTTELLLCAAFSSKHRHIVNSVSVMWNAIFEHATEVKYPDRLKDILVSLKSTVDIVLPGIETLSIDSGAAQHHSFVESQDDLEVLNQSSLRLSYQGPPLVSSSPTRSASPAAVKLLLPPKRRLDATPEPSRPKVGLRSTPRLRHDDSQIQFAPIDSSPREEVVDSQLLTERQKEVRDRQRESAAIFPEIRSSSAAGPRPSLSSPARKQVSQKQRATTPEPDPYEDVFSSTPTPRRGQTITIDDHEMDPPSSPPEPRKFSLPPKSQSRSSSREIPELNMDWEMESSPISGSPVINAQMVLSSASIPEIKLTDESSQVERGDSDGAALNNAVEDSFQFEVITSSVPNEEISMEAGVEEPELLAAATTDEVALAPELPLLPSTPKQHQVEDLASSDNDVFSDPIKSPEHLNSDEQDPPEDGDRLPGSFEVNPDDERSMMRMVVELESRKDDMPLSEVPASSPPQPSKTRIRGGRKKRMTPVTRQNEPQKVLEARPEIQQEPGTLTLDCITVAMPGAAKGGKRSSRKAKRSNQTEAETATIASPSSRTPRSHSRSEVSSPRTTSQEIQEQVAEVPSSQPSQPLKRKRGHSAVTEINRKKRRSPRGRAIDATADSQEAEAGGESQDTSQEIAQTVVQEPQLVTEVEEQQPSVELSSQVLFTGLEELQTRAVAPAPELTDYKDGHTTDDELESQLLQEQESAMASMSPQDGQAPAAPSFIIVEDSMDLDSTNPDLPMSVEARQGLNEVEAGENAVDLVAGAQAAEVVAPTTERELTPKDPEPGVVGQLVEDQRRMIARLKAASLSRDELNMLEDMFMEVKREMYSAAVRGRSSQ